MKAPQLATNDTLVKLVEPDIERDALLSVEWLNGELGRMTMRSMGNTDEAIDKILPATIEQEAARVKSFIEREDQLNWMIECDGKVVGSVWVDLVDSEDLPGPSVHIMIGDPDMRGRGIGSSTVKTVLDYLEKQGSDVIYSRHLTTSTHADKLLKFLGFTDLDKPYVRDALEFQNLVRNISTSAARY